MASVIETRIYPQDPDDSVIHYTDLDKIEAEWESYTSKTFTLSLSPTIGDGSDPYGIEIDLTEAEARCLAEQIHQVLAEIHRT